MLVLSRRNDEAVVIYSRSGAFEPMRVLVVNSFRAPKVRVGFEGNDDVVFLREEIYVQEFGPLKVQTAKRAS